MFDLKWVLCETMFFKRFFFLDGARSNFFCILYVFKLFFLNINSEVGNSC